MTSTYRETPINFGQEGQQRQQKEAVTNAEAQIQHFPQIQRHQLVEPSSSSSMSQMSSPAGFSFPQPLSLTIPSSTNTSQPVEQHTCVICGDDSDGLHFGQYTCRACAAFFRRTVSLKLNYTCKKDENCEIEKSARNMCRACRFKKCMSQGMLISAVQHARDGLGKRKEQRPYSISTSSDSTDVSSSGPEMKIIRSESGVLNDRFSAPSSTSSSSAFQHLQPTFQNVSITSAPQQLLSPNQSLILTTPGSAFGVLPTTTVLDQAAATILQLNNQASFNLQQGIVRASAEYETKPPVTVPVYPYIMNNLSNLQLSQLPSNGSASMFGTFQQSPIQQPSSSTNSSTPHFEGKNNGRYKHLSRMLEGYHHFVSLRKASFTLVEGYPQFLRRDGDAQDIPQSNFGTAKKSCKVETSLIMDVVEKFFIPFHQLPIEDKNKLFDYFYCLFSNTERAFRTYKTFDANDDRLLMPDGGYIKLSELDKFYANSSLVLGDPIQVAKIFENAMHYLVKVVVAHMRNISMSEMDLMTLFGMFIWTDTEEISAESMRTVMQIRNEIVVDLHAYYRSEMGLAEAEITLKVANLFLLLPKLEQSIKLLKENYNIAELFNMLSYEATECGRTGGCSSAGKGNQNQDD